MAGTQPRYPLPGRPPITPKVEEPTILGRLLLSRLRWLIPVVAIACGGETLDVQTTGTIEVTTSTTGVELDSDGYTVQVDAHPAEPIGPSGSLKKAELEPGDHAVRLSGVAANCAVTAPNPRTVSVTAGATTTVAFHVVCNHSAGSVRVTAATSGSQADPDGYTVMLDGTALQALAPNAEVTLERIAPGTRFVGLGGVANNCQVQGDNPRRVVVAAGSVAALAFSVRCAEPPPVSGTLRIVTATSGPDQDEDGYAVAVDGGTDQPIGLSATATLANIAAGEHRVQLSGITANCSLAGANPRTVTVPAGGVADVRFQITCVARPPTEGTLQVNTVTTGAEPYAQSYSVSVDGSPGQSIGPNASLPIPGLAPGVRSVGLSGVPDNCQLAGENPASVTVTAGVASLVTFSVACTEIPSTTGTLSVTTQTTGADPDPDGFRLAIDDGAGQHVGANATTVIAHLAAGPHTLTLGGVARNCTVEGEGSREFAIVVGDTTRVSFAVSCVSSSGDLKVTTATSGTPGDPDGYDVSVDGGVPQPIGSSGSHTFSGLAVGTHEVTLSGLAPNCQVSGENPLSVVVAALETVEAAFAVTCAATTGRLEIMVSGLPTGSAAAITVTGPNGFSRSLTGGATLADLAPGSYRVTAANVVVGPSTYAARPEQQDIEVAADATAQVTIGYGPLTSASLNLRIDGLYLTQGTQTYTNTVPLVAGRNGYLRVFVVANEANTARPAVRVRFYRGGTVIRSLTIPASGTSTPTSVEEGELAHSWNIPIPGSDIETGLSVLADVDPDNTVPESDEADNSFPRSGTPRSLDVRSVPNLAIRFVPVRQRANGLTGNVSESNKAQFLDLTQRIYPLRRIDSDVHAVYTTTTNTALSSDMGTWATVLNEIYALRTAEGAPHHYYGVVNAGPNPTWAGVGYLGAPAALGYDDSFDRSRVTAHELGHNWNRHHAPCGNPGGPDPSYPYSGGMIGVYGLDVARQALRATWYSDVMGYCVDPWVSDYTYKAVLDYRASGALVASAAQAEQPSLLVWGRIVNGQPVLEPAFQLVTQPRLPSQPGRYRIEGRNSAGATLFSLSFEPMEVADDPSGARHFAFAVPLDQARMTHLESLRLSGPGGPAAVRSRPAAQLRLGARPEPVRARRTAAGVSVQWDQAAHPMVMVRDPDTGEVLSFARGGEVEVRTTKGELEVTLSDQVLSNRQRVPVGGP